MLAPRNIPEEQTPCATITIIPPSTPQVPIEKTPEIISAMCTTEEYAITTFMSLVITQTIPKITLPVKEIITSLLNTLLGSIKKDRRTIPYPPNFSKMPAKIIDPDTGASTCALGNQRCNPNMGNFVKNAKTKKTVKKFLFIENEPNNIILDKLVDPLKNIKVTATIRSGREAKIV